MQNIFLINFQQGAQQTKTFLKIFYKHLDYF